VPVTITSSSTTTIFSLPSVLGKKHNKNAILIIVIIIYASLFRARSRQLGIEQNTIIMINSNSRNNNNRL